MLFEEATVMPGIKISNGVIIGFRSVVTKNNFEPYCIYAGVPSEKIGERK